MSYNPYMIIHFYTMPVIISMHTKSSRDNLSLELLLSLLVCAEWKQCDSSCSLDCENNLTLMLCACSGYTTWQNLASFGNETTQSCYVLIINGVDVINTALADLSSWSSYSISSYHDSYPPISCIRMESVHPGWMVQTDRNYLLSVWVRYLQILQMRLDVHRLYFSAE